MKKNTIVFLFLLSILTAKGQVANIRGMYVDSFNTILGNTVKEDSLLQYAQTNNFNYLALYDLWPIHVTYNLTNFSSSSVLASFIQKAKQNFNIAQVGAVGENYFFFNNVINVYNQQHTNPLQKFDVYNVEFEFWNTSTVSAGNYYCTTYLQPSGFSCDTAGAFSYYKSLIRQVDSLANANGVMSELYVGWFNQGQAIQFSTLIDRILLHDYISNYTSLYSYVNTRLQHIAARNSISDVVIIFSAEPSFMGSFLTSNPIGKPYADLVTAFNNAVGSWKQYIHLVGYQWFAYSFLPVHPITTTINEMQILEVSIYPNPCANYALFSFSEKVKGRIDVVNSLGQHVFTHSLHNEQTLQLNTSQFSKGMYYCAVYDEQNQKLTSKLLLVSQ